MRHKARILQRAIQIASLTLFCGLLFTTAWPLPGSFLPPDMYLRLDPLVAALIPVAAREWLPNLLPGLLVLGLTLLFGRIFCGYICPFGITLDLVRWLSGKIIPVNGVWKKKVLSPHWPKVKYLFLAVMAGAALVGVNLVFWGSPIALITRFYALFIHPLSLLFSGLGLSAARPVFESLDMTSLLYIPIAFRRFDSLYFVLAFFTLLFWLERIRPRFWCRYLCPAGALIGLFALLPRWRRRVKECVGCGLCAEKCPAGAILPDGLRTRHSECITCRACTDACPTRGTAFGFTAPLKVTLKGKAAARTEEAGNNRTLQPSDDNNDPQMPVLPSRRAFIGATAAGTAIAAAQYLGAHSLLHLGERGNLWSDKLVRPPASLPEPDFLDRCIRCGECMKACPTNGLQPTWFDAGPEGIFSPILVPRRGPCEPECNVCGRVCPTGAIRPLPLEEKQWAKMGTAVVLKHRCLAWAEGKRCMVCQETCPYGSVKIVQVEGAKVPAPVVNPLRCYGCGYCEQHCPTLVPAIVVEPLNPLRLDHAEYKMTAQSMNLYLRPGDHGLPSEDAHEGDLPPGFAPLDEERNSGQENGLPPGFSN